jgi:hypothetical protein
MNSSGASVVTGLLTNGGGGGPATVVKWHRKGFRIYWRWRSRCSGRPKTSDEIRDLIRQMSLDNPLWGAPRVHGELLKLGIEVSQATVGRYLPRRPKAPSPTWRSFLRNHMTVIVAVDMFVVATATFRMLYAWITIEGESSISRSPGTRRKFGSRSKSPRPFLGTPHLAICSETETRRMASASRIVFERWAFRKF